MNEIEILDSSSNAVVAKYSERNYPGLLLQGDTLRIVLDNLNELREELDAKDVSAAKEISDELCNQFLSLLIHYEKILKDHNLALPYTNPVCR